MQKIATLIHTIINFIVVHILKLLRLISLRTREVLRLLVRRINVSTFVKDKDLNGCKRKDRVI